MICLKRNEDKKYWPERPANRNKKTI
jgi:hypothetical protein